MKQIQFCLALIFVCCILIRCSSDDPITTPVDPMEQDETIIPAFLNLQYEGTIPDDNKIDFVLDETLGDVIIPHEGKVELRGGFSTGFPKKSFEIDLKDDISIAGLPEDDDWILNANYIDKTFLRHVVSFQLFRDMDSKNEASQTSYAEVTLNGEYNGLYVLMEKLDKSSLDVDKDDSESVIFKEPHLFKSDYDNVTPQDPSNFHQQIHPDIDEVNKNSFVETIRDFILNTSDVEFTESFEDVFDLQNIIDWHLLLLISNNGDGILKNFYLYKIDKNTPLRIAPWDYDHSFGRDGDNELNLDTRSLDITRSILFDRLLEFDWYKNDLKNRWTNLNSFKLLNVAGLKSRIDIQQKKIKSLAEKNFTKWPLDSEWYYDDNNFDEEVDIINQFIDLRHQRITEYFDNL